MSTDKKVKELKAWTAQMRRILKLQQGKGNEEELRSLRESLASLTSEDSSLPVGMRKLLAGLDSDKVLDVAPPDVDQRQMVEEFREPLLALLNRLAPVLTPEEDQAQRAWLELSAQSLALNRYELAMKALQDAWHEAKAIEDEKRVPPTPSGQNGDSGAPTTTASKDSPPEDSPLRAMVEESLRQLDEQSRQLEALSPEAQVEMALFASLTQQAMKVGQDGLALGLVAQWGKAIERVLAEQAKERLLREQAEARLLAEERARTLRRLIDDDVYTPNAGLKAMEAPLALVPHSDTWFDKTAVSQDEWDSALKGVVADQQRVQEALVQARLEVQSAREKVTAARQTALEALGRLKPLATDSEGEEETRQSTDADGTLDALGLKALAERLRQWQALAQRWEARILLLQKAKDDLGEAEREAQARLKKVAREISSSLAKLELQFQEGQKQAGLRDWVKALETFKACTVAADEAIRLQREDVTRGAGAHCEPTYMEALFDALGADAVKKLGADVGPKTLGELSKAFTADALKDLQAELGDGKAVKTWLTDVCDGKPAELKKLRDAFGSMAAVKAVAAQAFGGKTKTIGALLKTGFSGDPAKFKDFIDGFPNPDPEALKRNDPAALKAQKDQKNLSDLLSQGGLNDNPEVFAHLVGTGCKGQAQGIKDLHAKFSGSTPPGLDGMKALLDTAGLKVPPQRLAEILATGCSGIAQNLKELAIGFDGKMPQLKEMADTWGDDTGPALKTLTSPRHLKGNYQALQKQFAKKLNDAFPGGGNKARRQALMKEAPNFARTVLKNDQNSKLARPLKLDEKDVGTLKDTDWDHLLMHVCERHLPGSFAFTGAKAAAVPINKSNTQFPPDWTPQDIADLLRKALASDDAKVALAALEADAVQAEKAWRWAEWDLLTKRYAAWQLKAQRYDQWMDREEWWNNGGRLWTRYQMVLARGESWNSRNIPKDPGPEPPRVPDQWGALPGDEPELPGPEPEYAVEPKWDPQVFWYDGVQFQIGADYKKGKRQITQFFPLASLGDPPLKAFSRSDMETLRDAMIF